MTLLKNKIFFNGEITKNWAILVPDIWGDFYIMIYKNNFFTKKNIIHFFYIVSYIIYKSPLEACFSCFIKLKAPPGIFVEKKFLFLKVF